MRVGKRARMRRTQISLMPEEMEAVRKAAVKRRISMSKLIRSAIKRELQVEHAAEDRMFDIVGLGAGSDSKGSERHDEIIYG